MPTSPFHVETMGPISEGEDKRQKQSAKNTVDRKSGKKVSYDSAYADADMKKYGGKDGKAKFIKDAKAYNANKNKSKKSESKSKSNNTPGKGENAINKIGKEIKNRTPADLTKVKAETNISNALDTKYKGKTLTAYEKMQAKQKELSKKNSNKSETTKSETPKSEDKPVKETRLDRRLAKTQKKGKNIADGKGVKTAKEQRKALRLKKRETRLKKRIEKNCIKSNQTIKQ